MKNHLSFYFWSVLHQVGIFTFLSWVSVFVCLPRPSDFAVLCILENTVELSGKKYCLSLRNKEGPLYTKWVRLGETVAFAVVNLHTLLGLHTSAVWSILQALMCQVNSVLWSGLQLSLNERVACSGLVFVYYTVLSVNATYCSTGETHSCFFWPFGGCRG